MTTVQRVIKYLAIAFAALLIVGIITTIIGVGEGLTSVFYHKNNKEIIETKDVTEIVNKLRVDLKYASLEIKEDDEFKVELTSNKITVNVKDNELLIQDTNNKKFFNSTKDSVILHIPENTSFELVNISNGAGSLTIDSILTNELILELGLGKTSINYLEANKLEINTGTGSFKINDCKINDSNISVGVGKLEINGLLTGHNEIEAGVGEIILKLKGSNKDYELDVDKGIGSIKLNGEKIKNDTTIGKGETFIKIDGGIGSINITTEEKDSE